MRGMASFTSPWIAVDRRWRARMHPRPSRRTPLSNDTSAGPDASARASIGAPQITPLREFPLSQVCILYGWHELSSDGTFVNIFTSIVYIIIFHVKVLVN